LTAVVQSLIQGLITCHEVSDDNEHGIWDKPKRQYINQYFGNEKR